MEEEVGIARESLCVRRVTRRVSSVDGLVRDGYHGISMFMFYDIPSCSY